MIKAIETAYAGCRFRSRLEAKWAVFFDAMKIRWDFEPEGFEFDNGTRYLPDFWLPDLGLWVEIKGTPATAAELTKARLLAVEGDTAVLVVNGLPRAESPEKFGVMYAWSYGDGSGGADSAPCGSFILAEQGLSLDLVTRRDWYADSGCTKELLVPGPTNRIGGDLFPYKAYAAAKGARFEFGESGAKL